MANQALNSINLAFLFICLVYLTSSESIELYFALGSEHWKACILELSLSNTLGKLRYTENSYNKNK